jgi:hypothetical protein
MNYLMSPHAKGEPKLPSCGLVIHQVRVTVITLLEPESYSAVKLKF